MSTNRKSWDTFELMRAAAQEGDAQAQCYLGVCYQNGQGVEQNHQEAVKWFRKAADQDDPVAQCYLGVCYWMGQGVPQEFGEAAKWLREAAEQADPAAQFNFGMLYETGQGVPQNYAEAVKWYRESAERGYPAAQFNLGVFYETGQVVPQDFAEAVKWYRAAAEQEARRRAMQSWAVLPDRARRRKRIRRRRQMVHQGRAAGQQDGAAQSRPALCLHGSGGRSRPEVEKHAALKKPREFHESQTSFNPKNQGLVESSLENISRQFRQFFFRFAGVNRFDRQFPACRQRFRFPGHKQSRAGVEQNRVALRAAFVAAQNAADDFRVHKFVAAVQIRQRRRLQREIFRRQNRRVETAFLVKFRDVVGPSVESSSKKNR